MEWLRRFLNKPLGSVDASLIKASSARRKLETVDWDDLARSSRADVARNRYIWSLGSISLLSWSQLLPRLGKRVPIRNRLVSWIDAIPALFFAMHAAHA
jgi:hypothetical protein